MTRDEILGAASMPLASPSYPKGPFRFINREYLRSEERRVGKEC